MYQVGDLIVYGANGVCRVEALTVVGKEKRQYYALQPLHQTCQIMTPVDNEKVLIRPILTKDQAISLIDSIPGTEPEPFYARATRELAEHYETMLKTYDCQTLVRLIMSIYHKREQLRANKRRLGSTDENYLRKAQTLLHCELAVALDIPREQVEQYIDDRVRQVMEQ